MALRATGWALLVWTASGLPSAAADLKFAKVADTTADDALKVETQASLLSDYMYRGVSLSAHKPSAAAYVEAEWNHFYAATNVQSVKLPTNPASEITLSAGYRYTIAEIDFDLGASYFYYPGEIIPEGGNKTSYWEYALGVERDFTRFEVSGTLAYAPDISGTGAWGAYGEGKIKVDLPPLRLLKDIDWQLIASAGYWRFGNTSPAQGGFPLPSYANWRLGLAFAINEYLKLDLSYTDTNLSPEDCFVFTGDPVATPGGNPNPISNPDGLRSGLCGPAFVGTLTATLDMPRK